MLPSETPEIGGETAKSEEQRWETMKMVFKERRRKKEVREAAGYNSFAADSPELKGTK